MDCPSHKERAGSRRCRGKKSTTTEFRYDRTHGSEPVYWFIQLSEIEGVFVNPKELDNTKKK